MIMELRVNRVVNKSSCKLLGISVHDEIYRLSRKSRYILYLGI